VKPRNIIVAETVYVLESFYEVPVEEVARRRVILV
jgi:hypothetical protein